MCDPISVAGVALAVPAIVSNLVTYYSDAKNARSDIQQYVTDLFSFNGTLDYIESVRTIQSADDIYKYESADFALLVKASAEILQNLQLALDTKRSSSSLDQFVQRVTWNHKKKEVQGYFERLEQLKAAFVTIMMGDSLNYNQAILEELSHLRIDVSRDRAARDSIASRKERDALVNWLAPVGPESTHLTAYKAHHSDTGGWFRNGALKTLIDCPENNSAVLWLEGKSGSGKSTLLASAIEHLRAYESVTGTTALAYFYCSFSVLESQDPLNILSSLLVQLSETITPLFQELRAKYLPMAQEGRGRSIDLEVLVDIFRRYTNSRGFVFVAVDAINESEIPDKVNQMLLTLAETCENIRMIVTSTSGVDHAWLNNRNVRVLRYSMSAKAIDEDIRIYVDDYIARHVTLSSLSQSLKNEIKEAILNRANGVLTELNEAVVVDDDDDNLEDDARFQKPDILLRLGQGLFEYQTETGLVSLSHSPIKTFVTSRRIKSTKVAWFWINESDAHQAILITCLTYLQFNRWGWEATRSTSSYSKIASKYPLMSYAAQCWPFHIRDDGHGSWSRISAFLATKENPGGGNYGFWLKYMAGGLHAEIIQKSPSLYYAASFGYASLVTAIIAHEKDIDLEQRGGRYGSTALQVAAFRRQREVVKLLVEAGANPFSLDLGLGGGISSFFWAKENAWPDVLELMVRCGAANGFQPNKRAMRDIYRDSARRIQTVAMEQDTHGKISREVKSAPAGDHERVPPL
ncbi:MAG: hypothetical protein Q9178_002505 [Gyalolechia marmorata]